MAQTQTVPPSSSNLPQWLYQIARSLNQVIGGKVNVTLPATLSTGTTTTIVDARIGIQSAVLVQPTSADAAAALPNTYWTVSNGQVVATHPTGSADRTFMLAILG